MVEIFGTWSTRILLLTELSLLYLPSHTYVRKHVCSIEHTCTWEWHSYIHTYIQYILMSDVLICLYMIPYIRMCLHMHCNNIKGTLQSKYKLS